MATLKKSLLIFVILFGITSVLFSQNNNDSLNVENSVSVSEDSTLLQDDYFSSNNETSNLNLKQPSTAWTFIKMILFLCLVVAAIYAVMWFFKKKLNNTKSDDNFLRRVSSLNIGPGKSVEIVTLLDNAYILGVTDSNINVIDQIVDKELIEALNLNFDKNQNVKKPMNFADVLDIFMPNGPRNKNIYEDEERKVNNLSRKNKE
ncbi:MAG: flagellar biosynthetic protein FliO [Spirochaetia bacterium]|nr:flagellar biosynthetic protein FliO [Spirochaetia bacterium]